MRSNGNYLPSAPPLAERESSPPRWVNFDGNEPHCTLPYTGTRYTLIYFTHQSYSRLGSSQASPGRHCPSALSFCTVLLHCMAAVRRH